MLERRYCRQYVQKRLRAMVLVAVIAAVISASASVARGVIVQRNRDVRTRLSDLQRMSAQSRRDIQRVDKESVRYNWQQDLVGGTRSRMGDLNSVFTAATPDIWLQKLETLEKDGKIIVGGMATSYSALSMFTGNLRRNSNFAEVRIAGVKSSGNEADQSLAFSVEVKLGNAGGTAPAAQAAPASTGVPRIPGAT